MQYGGACHPDKGFVSDCGECGNMKLHDALRKIIRQFGVNVLSEKRLLFILSDFRAFEAYPALKPVFEAIVSNGSGKELMRLSLDDDREGCISYAQNLKKSLSEQRHFREDLADYAADSILYGLGLTDTVTEPSDHGFDPMEHGISTGNPGAGERKGPDAEEGKGRTEKNSGRDAKKWDAGTTRREPSAEKEKVTEVSRPEASGGGSAAPRNAGAKSPSSSLKWMIATVLLACVFVMGHLACSSSVDASGQYAYEQGEKYYFGIGGSADYGKALEWYRKAAEKGHSGAEYSIGRMYELGHGVSLDYQEAMRWYRKAAAQWNSDAQSGLERVCDKIDAGRQPGQCEYEYGEKYYFGYGVNADDRTALDWYLKAAKKGNSGAEYKLGWMYEQGKGVTPIYEMALRWYRKAAAHGNKDAQAGIVRVEKLISTGSYDRRY